MTFPGLSKTNSSLPVIDVVQHPTVKEMEDFVKVQSRRKSWKKANAVREFPGTVMIKVEGKLSYADTLRDARAGLGIAGLTSEEMSVSKMAGRKLCIRLQKQTTKTSEIQSVVEKSFGAETFASTMTAAMEIEGWMATSRGKELAVAMSKLAMTPITADSVKALKPRFTGKVLAVVMIPSRIANKLARKPPLRIGWVSCSVRVRVQVDRVTGVWASDTKDMFAKGQTDQTIARSAGKRETSARNVKQSHAVVCVRWKREMRQVDTFREVENAQISRDC